MHRNTPQFGSRDYFLFIFYQTTIAMDYFDASEELHNSIQDFMSEHAGKPPERIYVAPTLYEWLASIRRDESLLTGENPANLDMTVFPSEVGPLSVVIDELLSDYEIIAE
jgi:hypothetical protein